MNSEEQVNKWRAERQADGDDGSLPEPIESQQEENRRAERLVRQVRQLAEYEQEMETERGRS